MTICKTCGRSPSMRFGVDEEKVVRGVRATGFSTCKDPIHDIADSVAYPAPAPVRDARCQCEHAKHGAGCLNMHTRAVCTAYGTYKVCAHCVECMTTEPPIKRAPRPLTHEEKRALEPLKYYVFRSRLGRVECDEHGQPEAHTLASARNRAMVCSMRDRTACAVETTDPPRTVAVYENGEEKTVSKT